MARPLVVLADPDYTYLAPLELKFLEGLGNRIELEVITDEAYLLEWLTRPHDIEALLICEQWFGETVSRQNVRSSFVLTEERDAERTSNLEADYTFKYTSLNLIFNKVVGSCSALRSDERTGEAKVLLFYSPQGGSGKTTAALAVASALRGAYHRVLYVDAEHVQTFSCFMGGDLVAGPELVRAMQRPTRDAYQGVRDHIVSDGFDLFPPLRGSLASFGIAFDFFLDLIGSARGSGDYDYVVVDTDTALTDEKIRLLGMADKVVVMVTQDKVARHKLSCFLANIDGLDADTYKFICNRYRSEEQNAFGPAGMGCVELDGFVDYDATLPGMDVLMLGDVDGFRRLAHALE